MRDLDLQVFVSAAVLIQGLLSSCPEGWLHHGGRCYFRSPDAVSYNEARCVCADMGASLIQVKSPDDSAFIDQSLTDTTTPYWVGSTDLRDGVYVWEDGSAIVHLDWGVDQPDSVWDDHCVVYLMDTTVWGITPMLDKHYALDTSCNFMANPFCEKTVNGRNAVQRIFKLRGTGVIYPDHLLIEIEAVTFPNCAGECIAECRCRGVSFCPTTRRCLLYDGYASQLSGSTLNTTGCSLYD